MTYSSRRKEVDMKKVIMIIAVAAILVGCKGKGTRVQISDSVDKFKVEKLFVVDSITGGISWSVSINDDIMGSYINYVHQLQHILFAFGIGEEMEV